MPRADRLRFAALLPALFLVGACATFPPQGYGTHIVDEAARHEIVHDGLPLYSGEIILSELGAPDGFFQTLVPQEFYPYGHAGVIVVEDGQPWVYEGFGSIRPYLTGPPTDAASGTIRRVALDEFIDRNRFVAIYEPPAGVNARAVADFAVMSAARRTPFDPYFDYREHAKLYCTEFVALALEAGGAPSFEPVPVSRNPSLRVALDWLKVSAPAIIPAGLLPRDGHRVALISRDFSPPQVTAYFAAKSELHRRFTSDQRLGNLFTWSRITGLHLREEIRAFRRAAVDRAAQMPGAGDAQIAAAVRALGDEMFGPLQDAAGATLAAAPWQ